MLIQSLSIKPAEHGYCPVDLGTSRGSVECRYYAAPSATTAVVMVGGVGGGWDTPACNLYPALCEELAALGISGLRVRFRQPDDLEESVLDVLAGLSYLESEGVVSAALVGHSFGGAVVIQAAALAPSVRSVVALATQSFGAEPVAELAPRCSILLVHGEADQVLPPYCSQWAFFLAGNPKRLVLYEGAGHGLVEVADAVLEVVRDWLVEYLDASRTG